MSFPANFKEREFGCRCGQCDDLPHPDRIRHLAWALQKIRDKVGCPLKVTSGYRCADRNRAIGGAPASKHVQCYAADIKPVGKPVSDLFDAIQALRDAGEIPQGGLGKYTSWAHYDIRPGRPADWPSSMAYDNRHSYRADPQSRKPRPSMGGHLDVRAQRAGWRRLYC